MLLWSLKLFTMLLSYSKEFTDHIMLTNYLNKGLSKIPFFDNFFSLSKSRIFCH